MTKNKKENMQVLIGQPIEYPEKIVVLVKEFLTKNKNIKKAYLACIQYPDPNISPKILIGLEVKQGIKEIINDLEKKLIINNLNEIVELTDVNDMNFKEYFSKIDPFYYLDS